MAALMAAAMTTLPPLTVQQQAVARLVADACTNKQIAATLGLSLSRVKQLIDEVAVRWQVGQRPQNRRVQIARLYLAHCAPTLP